jgi:hypothetical protein
LQHRSLLRLALGALAAGALVAMTMTPAIAATPTYDITTLAGKVASLHGTAGLQVRFSALLEQEAEESQDEAAPAPAQPITPDFVLDSPLDHDAITPPNVLVNQDTHGAPQNETSIAVDPNNPDRIVASANDYVSRTWSCDVDGTPCSALGEGYSGTYFSNNGGATWCCASSGPNDLGTLIPGVNHLGGGIYDAAGDPSVAFDSKGNVFYAGLGFDRTAAPNTVEVSKGTFDGSGNLSWGDPTWINPTTSPSVLNDKEWIVVDSREGSQFQDRIYVSWTRFLFNARTGAYTQSPIAFVYSTDGGATFSTPVLVSGSVLYGQGSHVTVGPDGEVYIFWNGSTRLASLDGEYMVKSTDGGVTWSKPSQVSTVSDILPLRDTAFRVNSYPMATVDPTTGDVYDVWDAEVPNDGSTGSGTSGCAYWLAGTSAVRASCHSAVVYSKSTNGGADWSPPIAAFAQGNRTAVGYPVTNPDATTLDAPAATPIEDVFPSAASGANGRVYIGAYRGATVSPWQICDPAHTPPPPEGRINCEQLGNYINNTRLDYVVADLTTETTNTVSTWPINSRYGFGGGFFGDYTDMAVGSDGVFHALYTDTNDEQTVTWFYGFEFSPTQINQEDIVTASGSY